MRYAKRKKRTPARTKTHSATIDLERVTGIQSHYVANHPLQRREEVQSRCLWWLPVLLTWSAEGTTVLFQRTQGGGFVMVWAAFGHNGKTTNVFLDGLQNATAYQEVLHQHLLHGGRIGGRNWKFQQDNGPLHTARTTKEWFQDHGVQVVNWPARNQDLNPIENLWGSLVRLVYASGRQYNTTAELKAAIECSWDQIQLSELQKLVQSIPSV